MSGKSNRILGFESRLELALLDISRFRNKQDETNCDQGGIGPLKIYHNSKFEVK